MFCTYAECMGVQFLTTACTHHAWHMPVSAVGCECGCSMMVSLVYAGMQTEAQLEVCQGHLSGTRSCCVCALESVYPFVSYHTSCLALQPTMQCASLPERLLVHKSCIQKVVGCLHI